MSSDKSDNKDSFNGDIAHHKLLSNVYSNIASQAKCVDNKLTHPDMDVALAAILIPTFIHNDDDIRLLSGGKPAVTDGKLMLLDQNALASKALGSSSSHSTLVNIGSHDVSGWVGGLLRTAKLCALGDRTSSSDVCVVSVEDMASILEKKLSVKYENWDEMVGYDAPNRSHFAVVEALSPSDGFSLVGSGSFNKGAPEIAYAFKSATPNSELNDDHALDAFARQVGKKVAENDIFMDAINDFYLMAAYTSLSDDNSIPADQKSVDPVSDERKSKFSQSFSDVSQISRLQIDQCVDVLSRWNVFTSVIPDRAHFKELQESLNSAPSQKKSNRPKSPR